MRFTGAVLGSAFLGTMILLAGTTPVLGGCGCMDVALVVDDTGSMGGAIQNVKNALPTIISIAQAASAGDLRMGLVTFPNDNVVVSQPFTSDMTSVQSAIQAIILGNGAGIAESSDESLQYVITGAADSSCTVLNGPLGSFRSGCIKIAVLITDAPPGECADLFTPGVSDVHAHNVALAAAQAGILISAIYVPTAGEDPVVKAIMQDYAATTGGSFVETANNGAGTGQGLSNIIANRGGFSAQECVTRNARFWFTHAFYGAGASTNCANLLDAIKINGNVLDLGFLQLPTTFHGSGNTLDANAALVEALAFYYKNPGRAGNGPASPLCKQRKQLSIELIAATANVKLLGTDPSGCAYFNGVTTVNFPADLLDQARLVNRGEDPVACASMTQLLRKFNNSGLTNDLPCTVECSPVATKTLKSIASDPATQLNCPGLNENATQAWAIVSFPFSQSVNLANYTNDFPNPPCGVEGRDAVWKITPAIATAGSQFRASTFGSNFYTLLSIWTRSASSTNGVGASTNLTAIACSTNTAQGLQSQLSFTSDGASVYYIVVSGNNGSVGKAKLRVTSP
jgi:hypothetical protein